MESKFNKQQLELAKSVYEQDPNYYCEYFKVNMQRGYSVKDICKTLNISESTVSRWQTDYLEFRQAITEGRTPAIECAENKLMQLVNGFYYRNTKKEVSNGINGKETKIVEQKTFVPPSIHAIRFLLVNLRKDKWQSENRIEAQQDLLSIIQNASEAELVAVKNALIEARNKKQIDKPAEEKKVNEVIEVEANEKK